MKIYFVIVSVWLFFAFIVFEVILKREMEDGKTSVLIDLLRRTPFFAEKGHKLNHVEHHNDSVRQFGDADWIKRIIGVQKCNIPKFDAFHPQILPYVSMETVQTHKFSRFATIKDGKLYLKLRNVQEAGFYYIRRYQDFKSEYSDWTSLIKPNESTKGRDDVL